MKIIPYKHNFFQLIIVMFTLIVILTFLFGCNNSKEPIKHKEDVIAKKTTKPKKNDIVEKQNSYLQIPSRIDFKIDSKKVSLNSKNQSADVIQITNSINESVPNEGIGRIESSTNPEDLKKILTNDYVSLFYSESISIKLSDGDKLDFNKLIIPLDMEKECIIIGFKNEQQYNSDFGLLKVDNKLKDVLSPFK